MWALCAPLLAIRSMDAVVATICLFHQGGTAMHLKQLIATRTQLQFSSPYPAVDNLKPKLDSTVSLNS